MNKKIKFLNNQTNNVNLKIGDVYKISFNYNLRGWYFYQKDDNNILKFIDSNSILTLIDVKKNFISYGESKYSLYFLLDNKTIWVNEYTNIYDEIFVFEKII